jgi:hypothetical protein
MKKTFFFFLLVATAFLAGAQKKTPNPYRNFPLLVGVQFHALSEPLKDSKSAFANLGFFAGTEVSLNGKSNWVQQLTVAWQHNKAAGNSLMVYTQTAWRPAIAAGIYSEIKLGVGRYFNQKPFDSYEQKDGVWKKNEHGGKWMTMIPVGISIGYQPKSPKTMISPFVTYQVYAAGKYNPSAPIITNQLIQAGSRIHF